MRIFTETELGFSKVECVGSIAFLKRTRSLAPYDSWYVVEQVESCDGFRKRTTRTHTCFITANEDYQKRLALMKDKAVRGD